MTIDKFSPKQAEVLKFICEDKYDTLICDGAVRSGKTAVMSLAFVMWAMENFDRCNLAICGKTVQSAEKNVIKPLLAIEGLPYTLEYKRSERMLLISCGNTENYVYVYGGKDESSYMLIQGITLAGVFFDEVALMPQSFVDQAISRTLTFGEAKIWFNCNPESPAHWFYQTYLDEGQEEQPNVKHLHFLMSDNPIMTPDKIEKAESRFVGVFYERYVLGRWVVAEGLVYKVFDEKKHVTDIIPESGKYYISVDYGTLNPCSMGLWCVHDGVAYRVKEYYYDGREKGIQLTDEEYYNELVKLAGNNYIQYVIIDPSAASFKTTIRKHNKFSVRNAKNDVIYGINRTATFIQQGKIKIHYSCKDIIKEFKAYRYDEDSTEDKVIKEYDHAMDDMRYFVNTILDREWR